MAGYGIYEYSNGSKYEGYWQDNKPNGFGRETFLDKSFYEGNYVNGLK
jgi:hypothetical protein